MLRRTLLVAAVLFTPTTAFALGEESFGNAPKVKQPEWAVGVVDVVNHPSRVYSQWVNGNEYFFYHGDAKALNETLAAFAAVKDDVRTVVFLPGTGETKSFRGKEVAFDWQLHVPSGIYRAMTKETRAVLTVYVKAAKPGPLADRPAAEKWIGDLDHPVFRDREAAEAELRKLGRPAKPVLRAALAGQPSAEQKHRIEKLLKDLADLDVTDLVMPKGLTVIGVDELIEQYKKGMSDTDVTRRALSVNSLAALAAYDDTVVPTLEKLLGPENNEYVRRMAAYGLGQAGALAKPTLPALKAGLDDPDKNVAAACKTAVEQIEAAKESPTREAEAKVTKSILEDIRGLKKVVEKK